MSKRETQAAAALLGRKGGKVKSDRKAAAARENGKRGGRPKSTPIGQLKETVKILLVALALLAVTACGYHSPTAPTPPALPQPGVPARLELGFTAGVGIDGGTATITAKVIDAFAAVLPHQTVTFVTSAGTLTPDAAETNEKGIATTAITASDIVTVTATVAGLTAKTLVAIQPIILPPVIPPPPPPPAPLPPPPPSAPPPPGTYSVIVSATPAAILVGSSTTLSAVVNRDNNAPVPSTYTWDCANGTAPTTSANASTVCVYLSVGTFLARVTATGGTVTGNGAALVTVSAIPPPPVTVSLTSSAPSVAVGATLTFTAAVGSLMAGETVVAYQWDLDGTVGYESTTTTSPRVSGVYVAPPGLFTATVKVTTSTGRTATATVGYVVTN